MNLRTSRLTTRGSLRVAASLLLLGALLPVPAARGRTPSVTEAPPPLRTGDADLRSGTCTPGPTHVDRGDDYVERLLRAHPEQFA
ncbi:MAG: hypothetical protein KBB95_15270, partial [Deltaproteobacteria bacterium]|nr:hypothetical protein [Deltaproteobacteria bacterium]